MIEFLLSSAYFEAFVIVVLLTVAAAMLSRLLASRRRAERDSKHVFVADEFSKRLRALYDIDGIIESKDVYNAYIEAASSAAPSGSVSETGVLQYIDEDVASLKERVGQIEDRLPAQETVDKVANVNYAILAKSIEHLTESIRNIERKLLNRWDIAKIVFAILGILLALLSAALYVVDRLSKQPGVSG